MKALCPKCGKPIRVRLSDDKLSNHSVYRYETAVRETYKCPGSNSPLHDLAIRDEK